MKYTYIYSIVFCFIFVSNSFAQVDDTVKVISEVQAWKFDDSYTYREKVGIDTSISQYQNYAPNARISDYTLDLGSFGSPAFSLQFSPLQSTPFYIQGFDKVIITPDKMLDYTAPRPYTELYYSVSKNQEQQVKFIHTQNYNKDLNVGVALNFYQSLGEYEPQSITGKHVAPWLSYSGSRFSTYFKYSYNSILFDVNGGINADSLINEKRFITSLPKAKSHITSQHALFIQKWNLAQVSAIIDSSSLELPQYPLAFGIRSDFNSTQHLYTDESVSLTWYENTLWDTLQTHDTTKYKSIKEYVFLESNLISTISKLHIVIGTGYHYESNNYRDYNYSYPSYYGNSMYMANKFLYEFIKPKILVKHNHTLYYYGNLINDVYAYTEISKKFTLPKDKELLVFASHKFEHSTPHSMYTDFMSNHYVWNEKFFKVESQTISGGFVSTLGNITANATMYKSQNYLYFDAFGQISQAEKPGTAIVCDVKKETKLWKFELQNGAIFQSSDYKGLEYPNWASYNSIAFHSIFYKKLVNFKLGVEGLYYPKYYVPQYNASLGTYTRQHTSEIGDFPQVNAFLSIKYKPIRVLLKYNGLYTQFQEKNFIALHYPQPSSYVTFAVSWLFYN